MSSARDVFPPLVAALALALAGCQTTPSTSASAAPATGAGVTANSARLDTRSGFLTN